MASKWEADGQSAENLALELMKEMATHMTLVDGRIGVTLGDYEFCEDALHGLVRHEFDMADDTIFKEFDQAIRHCFKQDQGLTNAKKLLAEFDRRCGALLANKSDYVLVTSMNIADVVPRRRSIRGCQISFHRKLPAKFRLDRARLLKIENKVKVNNENEGYVFVVVRASAVNHQTAYDNAMDALAIYRGLCQLHTKKTIRMFAQAGDPRYPSDAALKLGNLHTMHLPDGTAAVESHWFEDSHIRERPTTIGGFPLMEERVGALLGKLQRASAQYRKFCERALLNYVAAIDCRDAEARFVKLWLCLELLTDADDAKQIIKRVVFFYAQQDLVKGVLRSLRAARNSHVHGGATPARIDLKNFKMCEFIEHLLFFVLRNHFKFTQPTQWQEFMSTTTDMTSIDEQIARLRMVKKFASPVIDPTPAP